MAKPAFEVKKLECDAFDSRVHERHLASGRITPADLQTHLQSLPDETAFALKVTVFTDGEGPIRRK